MKRLFVLFSIISSITLLTGCLKDNISDDLQGEWRLLGWEIDSVYHEVDSFKVEYHKFSIEFSGNYVKAYSLANVTDFGKVRSKENVLIKEYVTQTYSLALDDESIFFDQYIGKINRYENIGNKLKLYFTDDDYFLFTNQFTDKVKPSCNCEQDIIMTVDNQQGIILDNGKLYLSSTYIRTGTLKVGGANNTNGTIEMRNANNTVIGGINNTEIYHKHTNNDKVSMNAGGLYFYRNTSTEIGSISKYVNGNKYYLRVYGQDSVDITSKGEIVLRTEDSSNVYPGLTVSKSASHPVTVQGNSVSSQTIKMPTAINSNGVVTAWETYKIVGGIIYSS